MIKTIFSLLCVFVFSVSAFSQEMTIKVYFANENSNPNIEDCTKVEPAKRTISKTKAVAKAALEELFKGVSPKEREKGFSSLSQNETRDILKSIKIKNKSAYVNFRNAVYRQTETATTSCGSGIFMASIEATLKQFPTIEKVFYAIEGSPADFYDWVQIGECPEELKNCSCKDF